MGVFDLNLPFSNAYLASVSLNPLAPRRCPYITATVNIPNKELACLKIYALKTSEGILWLWIEEVTPTGMNWPLWGYSHFNPFCWASVVLWRLHRQGERCFEFPQKDARSLHSNYPPQQNPFSSSANVTGAEATSEFFSLVVAFLEKQQQILHSGRERWRERKEKVRSEHSSVAEEAIDGIKAHE